MNLFLAFLFKTIPVLLFQQLSTEEGVPYEPNDGPGWILIVLAVVVLAALVFVLLRVFKGLQRSRESEINKEGAGSSQAPEE